MQPNKHNNRVYNECDHIDSCCAVFTCCADVEGGGVVAAATTAATRASLGNRFITYDRNSIITNKLRC